MVMFSDIEASAWLPHLFSRLTLVYKENFGGFAHRASTDTSLNVQEKENCKFRQLVFERNKIFNLSLNDGALPKLKLRSNIFCACANIVLGLKWLTIEKH